MSNEPPYQTPLERHPEVLRLIGALSVEATNLDVSLARLLSAVLHIDPHYGSIVYLTPKSAYARLEILTNSIKEATENKSQIQKELLSLTDRASKLIGKRHEAMHLAWGVSQQDPDTVVTSKLPFKIDKESEPKTVESLQRTVSDIRSLFTEIWEKTDQMFQDWPPYTWPETTQAPGPHESKQ